MKLLRKIFFIISLTALTVALTVILGSCGECVHAVTTKWEITREATCELEGEKTSQCIDCGETLTESIEKKSHVYGEYQYDDNATCSFIGTSTATCEGCGITQSKTNDGNPYGHTYFDGICSLCGDTMTLLDSWDASAGDTDSVTVKVYKAADGHYELDVTGDGSMRDFSDGEAAPWDVYSSNITTLHFYEGVTRIGDRAFRNLSVADHVYVEKGHKTFGTKVFAEGYTAAITHVYDIATWVSFEFEDNGAPQIYNTTLIYVGDVVKDDAGKKRVENRSTTVGDLEIPEGVEKINPYAFYNCAHMLTVTLPTTVNEIGDWAFYGCKRLTEVHIPSLDVWCKISFAENYANPLIVGGSLFVDSELVQHLAIPDSITTITKGAFEGATCISKLTLGSGLTEIPDYAFYNCFNIEEIEFSSQLQTIGAWAFYGCDSLVKLEIPENVKTVKNDAFRDCTRLAFVSTGGVSALGDSVFSGCRELVHVTLNANLTEISENAFSGCEKVIEIRNLTSLDISEYGFAEGVLNLCGTDDPSKITIISNAESENDNGLIFYVDGDTRLLIGYVGDRSELTLADGLVDGSFEIYKKAFYRGYIKKLVIEGGVTSFHKDAFLETSITSVTIPSVEAWCAISFDGASSNPLYYATQLFIGDGESEVTEITIPDAITAIPAYAFAGLGQIKSFTLHDGVVSVGRDAFLECVSAMKTSNYVSYIDKWVVSVDKTRASVSFLASTRNFADGVFDGAVFDTASANASLLSMLPKDKIVKLTVTGGELTADALAEFTSLESLSINSTIKLDDIDPQAFRGCTATKISVTAACLPLFDASKITSLTIVGGDIKREDTAAYSGIKELTVTTGVTSAEKASFKDFTSLEKAQITGGLSSLPEEMFAGCTALKSVSLHTGMITVGKNAFDGCTQAMSYERGSYYISSWLVGVDENAEYAVVRADTLGIASGVFTSSSTVKSVYYFERSAFWDAVRKNTGSNTKLNEVTVYYYREIAPYMSGNFWHLVDDVPTPWPPYVAE